MTHHLHSFYLTVTEIISGALGEVSAPMFVTSNKKKRRKSCFYSCLHDGSMDLCMCVKVCVFFVKTHTDRNLEYALCVQDQGRKSIQRDTGSRGMINVLSDSCWRDIGAISRPSGSSLHCDRQHIL